MDLLIALLVIISYFIGSKAILHDKYNPSIYSRFIWQFLAINSFASVVALNNNFTVQLLAGLGVLGNASILLLSFKKSLRTFGITEILCSILLVASLAIWIFTKLPLLNLTIGLIAHLIAGIPTIKKVFLNPKDEDLLFWFFFFAATFLALFKVETRQISSYLYPLYFTIFDGSMVLLCLRRYIKV
jgi:hypothetical protein